MYQTHIWLSVWYFPLARHHFSIILQVRKLRL